MRSGRISRAQLGLIFGLAIALTGTLLARSTTASSELPTPPLEPQFLSWSGDPFDDGLNHFLIALEPSDPIPTGSWLRMEDGEHLVAATPPDADQVDVAELEAAVGGNRTAVPPEDIIGALAAHRRITEIRPIGFGMYAVSGTIDRATLLGLDGVADATFDPSLQATTVDPYYPSQWALENTGASHEPWTLTTDADIDAPEAWHRTRGNGVVVAIVDSGVDVTHPDLAANIWANPGEQCGNGIDDDGNGYVDDCAGWDFANNDATVDDLIGHGTHVAGIVAAQADNGIGISGVAYESDVMVLKVGDGTPALSAAIEAIGYAIDNGARVINCSWLIDDADAPRFLDVALDAAEQAGVLVVTGAGNDPVDIDAQAIYPATSPQTNIITVGASTGTDQPAAFSGYGPRSVDLFAPGEHIVSTIPGGYGVYSGSSMSAPMVSGAAALLWAATPAASYQEVKGALLDRSDGPNDGVVAYRNLAASDGRLNIDRAMYTVLFAPPLMYSFYDFNSFQPGQLHEVKVTAKTVDPWRLPPQIPAMYRVGLYAPQDGRPMAVVGHDIVYSGSNGESLHTTDGFGRSLVGDIFERQQRAAFVQGGDTTTLTMTLPAGAYAFVTEVVDVTNADRPIVMGDPSAVFFQVSEDGTVNPMPSIPIGGETPMPTTIAPTDTGSPTTSTTTLPTSSTTTTTAPSPPDDRPTTTIDQTVPSASTTAAPTPPTTVAPTTTTTATSPTTAAPLPEPTTTMAPPSTTTAAMPSTTTTTAGPGDDSGPTTTTTTTQPEPATGMTIANINPDQGPTIGGISVTISGSNLPESVLVYFGDKQAEIITVIAPTFVVVDAPSGSPGTVDVTVKDQLSDESFTFQDGFTYLSSDSASTTSTSPELPATSAGPSTTVFVTTTVAEPGSTTTTPPPTGGPGGSLDDWLDTLLTTPDGLTLAPPATDDPMGALPLRVWAGALCTEPVCPGWVLES